MKLIDAIAICAFVLCSNTIVHGNTAVEILDAAGIQGGLIVHLGCGDGRLTAALRAGDNCVVQGLDTDPQHVEAARKHIQSLGISRQGLGRSVRWQTTALRGQLRQSHRGR